MGRLSDEFGSLHFANEASVSQNFILPLLRHYLGYENEEIIPERYYPVRDIYSGVKFGEAGSKSLNHRPDFVVCQNGDVNQPKFIIDSKGPNEGIDEHLGQLQSYAISVGKNLVMMTNGKEVKVYDVNNLLFYSESIDDLQLKLEHLNELLGRSVQVLKSPTEIIKDFDFSKAITQSRQGQIDQQIQKRQVLLSDFQKYLQSLSKEFEDWHLPTKYFQALDNLKLEGINPNLLLSFEQHTSEIAYSRKRPIRLFEIESDRTLNVKVFVGETGTGKSCLLKYLASQFAQNCLRYQETRIPVFISLREIGISNKLEDLIIRTLNQHDYRCDSFYNLPQENDFFFLLDAYDEIGEQFLPEVFSAIEHLSSRFECYVTSRLNRIPSFKPSVVFDIQPLSIEQAKEIVRHHIGDRYYEFQRQLDDSQIGQESGNILLLLFLISSFKDSGSLPRTVTRVIRTIVDRIKKWQDSKRQANSSLSWKAIEQFLADIAYKMIDAGRASLSEEDVEPMLLDRLFSLEQVRAITSGLDMSRVRKTLVETGLLIDNGDHLYFWHRLFLNYFSTLGLRAEYLKDSSKIRGLVHDGKWHAAIVGLASHLPSVTNLINDTKGSLWLAASCLRENNQCDEAPTQEIVSELIELMYSSVPNVRRRAAIFLESINHENVRKFSFEVMKGNAPADVRMWAICVIAKTKTKEALSIISQNLDWDQNSFILGPSSQVYIVRALHYYDEKEHLQIIENWKRFNNHFLDEECYKIFLELHSKEKLTQELVDALQQFFIDEYTRKKHGRDKLVYLGKILALVPNESFAIELINLPIVEDPISKLDGLYPLLKAYRSDYVIELLMKQIFAQADKDYIDYKLVDIIVDSDHAIPKDIFIKLTGHPNINVASKAIRGLKRFPIEIVKEGLNSFLNGDQPQLQSASLQVFVDNGELIQLIRQKKFPSHFYTPTAHTLLEAVRRFYLAEALHLMEGIFTAMQVKKRYIDEYNLALNLAQTFNFIGEKERHFQIISWFFDGTKFLQNSKYVHFDLMKNLKFFDSSLFMPICKCYFDTYYPFEGDHHYSIEVFLEAIEEIGLKEAVLFIKRVVQSLIDQVKEGSSQARYWLERPMRTLVSLVEPSDEDWVLEQLDEMKYDTGFEFPQLRRAVECLAYSGSAKSLPYVKAIAIQMQNNGLVLDVCQVAYEQICQRENVPYTKGDVLNSLQVDMK